MEEKKMEIPLMDLYTFNKNIIKTNFKPIRKKDLFNKCKCAIEDYLKETSSIPGEDPTANYHLLLSNELRYYTVIRDVTKSVDSFAKSLEECLWNIGKIYDIDLAQPAKDALEIWVSPKGTDELYVMYLMRYDSGIMEV